MSKKGTKESMKGQKKGNKEVSISAEELKLLQKRAALAEKERDTARKEAERIAGYAQELKDELDDKEDDDREDKGFRDTGRSTRGLLPPGYVEVTDEEPIEERIKGKLREAGITPGSDVIRIYLKCYNTVTKAWEDMGTFEVSSEEDIKTKEEIGQEFGGGYYTGQVWAAGGMRDKFSFRLSEKRYGKGRTEEKEKIQGNDNSAIAAVIQSANMRAEAAEKRNHELMLEMIKGRNSSPGMGAAEILTIAEKLASRQSGKDLDPMEFVKMGIDLHKQATKNTDPADFMQTLGGILTDAAHAVKPVVKAYAEKVMAGQAAAGGKQITAGGPDGGNKQQIDLAAQAAAYNAIAGTLISQVHYGYSKDPKEDYYVYVDEILDIDDYGFLREAIMKYSNEELIAFILQIQNPKVTVYLSDNDFVNYVKSIFTDTREELQKQPPAVDLDAAAAEKAEMEKKAEEERLAAEEEKKQKEKLEKKRIKLLKEAEELKIENADKLDITGLQEAIKKIKSAKVN